MKTSLSTAANKSKAAPASGDMALTREELEKKIQLVDEQIQTLRAEQRKYAALLDFTLAV
jgi:ABC-type phosphate transport system auxiliary subunit